MTLRKSCSLGDGVNCESTLNPPCIAYPHTGEALFLIVARLEMAIDIWCTQLRTKLKWQYLVTYPLSRCVIFTPFSRRVAGAVRKRGNSLMFYSHLQRLARETESFRRLGPLEERGEAAVASGAPLQPVSLQTHWRLSALGCRIWCVEITSRDKSVEGNKWCLLNF